MISSCVLGSGPGVGFEELETVAKSVSVAPERTKHYEPERNPELQLNELIERNLNLQHG